jgi:cathepsin L
MRETGQMFTGEEYQTRFGIWLSNQRLVREHNAANGATFALAMNKLAHLTPAEYKALLGFRMNLAQRDAPKSTLKSSRNVDAIDWRDKGVVNPVKDQAQCGSCWAFSTIQAQEAGYAIKTGKLQRLSEQNLVDCVTTCYGCNGGLMDAAYTYVIKYQDGMFMLEEDYPYTAKDGSCKFAKDKAVQKVAGYINIRQGSEADLADKIANYGPACIAIDASHYSFQLYSSGIYDESSCSSSSLDHGVGCVGFGKEGDKAYWIVRNSWGSSWGEQGYCRMIKDKNNQCGEATMACIPTY